MNRIWNRYSWLFHVIGAVFISGMAWAGVTSQAGRIDKLEAKHESLNEKVDVIKVDTAVIKQTVTDIKEALRRR